MTRIFKNRQIWTYSYPVFESDETIKLYFSVKMHNL